MAKMLICCRTQLWHMHRIVSKIKCDCPCSKRKWNILFRWPHVCGRQRWKDSLQKKAWLRKAQDIGMYYSSKEKKDYVLQQQREERLFNWFQLPYELRTKSISIYQLRLRKSSDRCTRWWLIKERSTYRELEIGNNVAWPHIFAWPRLQSVHGRSGLGSTEIYS